MLLALSDILYLANHKQLVLVLAPIDYNLPFAIKADQCLTKTFDINTREDIYNKLIDYR
jgi:hypothetical protein